MDVSLSVRRVVFLLPLIILFAACGNRFDLSKERGRQARIDEANFFLSQGNCGAALEAIEPLAGSDQYVTDEVRIIKSSGYACLSGFRMLSMAVSFASSGGNFFTGMVKGLGEGGGISNFYKASDVITRDLAALPASARTQRENSYMVFLQMGVIASILKQYGAPNSSGEQTADLVYSASSSPPGEMANADACALTASFSHISDSFSSSGLSDADTATLKAKIDSVCVVAGLSSCAQINRDRSLCDGTNANSVTAQAIVSGVNSAW